MMTQKYLDYLFKILGLLGLLVIGFYLYRGIIQVFSFGEILLSASGVVINEKPKEQTGITETKPINLKLWGQYEIDVPQNYIKYPKQILHPEENIDFLHLWAMYPTFEGYTSASSGIFNEVHKDNNVVRFTIYPFSSFKNRDEEEKQRKEYGQEGVKGILDIHKNYKTTAQEQQPFSNPTEYFSPVKNGIYFYIYDAGDHVVYINCHGGIRQKFHGETCEAKKLWGNLIAISYEFGMSNLGSFGLIEKETDKLIKSFNLREINHD